MADEDVWRNRQMCPYDAMGDYSVFLKKEDSIAPKTATEQDSPEKDKE